MTLQSELGLKKPFRTPGHEALLSIQYTAARIKKRGDALFRALGLTDVQFNLMMLLKHHANDDGGLTQVELSRMMLVNRANITSVVDRMERARLVRRDSVPGDRRYNVVKLTPRGDGLVEKAEKAYREKIDDLMGVVGDSALRALIKTLNGVRNHLDEIPAP